MARERQPWERQAGEPVRYYRRFQSYLNLGPERSVRKACEIAKLPRKGRKPGFQSWRKKAQIWNWSKRARAFDEWQNEMRQNEADRLAVEAAIEEAEENERQRRLRIQEARAVRTAGGSIVKRFLEILQAGDLAGVGLERRKTVSQVGDKGTYERTETETKGITELLGQAVQAVIDGAKAERTELGEASERHEVTFSEQTLRRLAEVVAERVPREDWETVAAEIDAIIRGGRGDGKPE